MLAFKFNFQKTFQAAVVLLKRHSGHMESIRLLKLLYVADRELLAEIGRTLTGDEPAAMRRGPVLRTVQKLIKGSTDVAGFPEWAAVIRKDGHELSLQGDAQVTRLTKAELKKLKGVSDRFWDIDSEELSEETHKFGEWVEAFDDSQPDASFPIQWESALEAQGKGDLIPAARHSQEQRELAEAAFRE